MKCPFCLSFNLVKSQDDYGVEWPKQPVLLETTHYCAGCRSFYGAPDGRAWSCSGQPKTQGEIGQIIYEPGREPKPEPDPPAGPSSRVRFLGGIS